MRHGLLLTAVATVTIPGLLAVLAVRAHEQVSAETGVAMAAAAALSGQSPATVRSAGRNDLAVSGGGLLTVLSLMTHRAQAQGMSMLDKAAAAGLATSYQGTELVSQAELDGGVSTVSQVWHQADGGTVVQSAVVQSAVVQSAVVQSAVVQSAGASTAEAGSALDTASPEGVFGVTKALVSVLGQYYVAMYQGDGSVVGRPAAVVELYRPDGSVAARFWLDKQTMVPLRREVFDTAGRVVSQDAFTRVRFGALSGRRVAIRARQAQSAWVTAAAPVKFLTSLASAGWRLPGSLPDNLPLYRAASGSTASGEVVDLEYSDGLYDVSLFVERGTLAADLPGWRRVTVDSQRAYASGHAVTWATSGFVYTVIADAPPEAVTAFVAAIPRDGSPGVLGRLGRGFERLGRMIDPFS